MKNRESKRKNRGKQRKKEIHWKKREEIEENKTKIAREREYEK